QVDSFYLDCHHDDRDGADEPQTDADRMHDAIGDDLSAVVIPTDLPRTSVRHSNELVWRVHDLRQLAAGNGAINRTAHACPALRPASGGKSRSLPPALITTSTPPCQPCTKAGRWPRDTSLLKPLNHLDQSSSNVRPRTASGHAAAAPPSSVMNSRRLTARCLPCSRPKG